MVANRIIVAGSAKSGTTAIFFRLKYSAGEGYVGVFRTAQL